MPFLDNKTHITRKAIFALIVASFIWGASAPIMKWTLLVTPVYTLAFVRFFTASLLLLLLKPQLKLEKKDMLLVLLNSIVGITIHIPLFFYGLRYTSSINAGIIATSAPVLVMIFAALFLGEKITKNLCIAAMLGMVGVFIVIFGPLKTNGFSMSILGNLLLLLAVLYNVGYEIVNKKLYNRYKPLTITFYSSFIGGFFLLPFVIRELSQETRTMSEIVNTPNFYLGVPFGIIITSIVGYLLWQWGLSKLPASKVGFFIYLDPVIAAVIAFFLLGETITVPILMGAILIVVALYFAESKHPYHHLLHVIRRRESEYPHK